MVYRWKDRLQLRRLESIALLVALTAGGTAPLATFSGDAGRLLVTFLGLVAASILPTISLILGCMTASGRSVKAINALADELTAAIDALFLLFGLVGVAVVTLLALAIPTPSFAAQVPHLPTVLQRSGQAIVLAAAMLIILRSGQIPGIIRRSMNIRREIAVDEARRRTLENAPAFGATKESFPTHPNFGKVVDLDEIQKGDPH